MKNIILFLQLFLSTHLFFSQAPPFAWAHNIGGVGDDKVRNSYVDAQGNIYITGSYGGLVDFDPGVGTNNLYAVLLKDAFIAKYNSSGELTWARSIGGSLNDGGSTITVDEEGNVYVAGSFWNEVDMDPGAGEFNMTAYGEGVAPDIFLLKLDVNGEFVYAKQIGGDGYDFARDIVLDAAGNIHLIGGFEQTTTIGTIDGVDVELTSNGNTDVFFCKMDNDGNLTWARSFGSVASDSDSASGIAVNAQGEVYITGSYTYEVDFDPGEGEVLITNQGDDIYTDIFIEKLDAEGHFLWVQSIGALGSDAGVSIVTDAFGDVLVTGFFQYAVDFDSGKEAFTLDSPIYWTPFVLKLGGEGEFIWVGSLDGGLCSGSPRDLATDAQGNVYTTGFFTGTADFDPEVPQELITSQGSGDAYIWKLTGNGLYAWAKTMGAGASDEGSSVQLDSDGNVYTSGHFSESVNFNTDGGFTEITSNGMADVFIHKMGQGGSAVEDATGTSMGDFVYPNPAADLATISWNNGSFTNGASIVIYDVMGKEIFNRNVNTGVHQYIVDTHSWPAGIYVYHIRSGAGEGDKMGKMEVRH